MGPGCVRAGITKITCCGARLETITNRANGVSDEWNVWMKEMILSLQYMVSVPD